MPNPTGRTTIKILEAEAYPVASLKQIKISMDDAEREKSAGIETGSENHGRELELVTLLGQEKNIEKLAELLRLPREVFQFSLDCVGDTRRRSTIVINETEQVLTNFTHMARVALMMKQYFPEDSFGRFLAMLHDIKEEALADKKDAYKDADEKFNVPSLAKTIEMLTEEEPSEAEIALAHSEIPAESNATYIARYRNYIQLLHQNWPKIGNLELCDRLDGVINLEYLKDPKYENRRKHKALESFGRIWATLSVSSDPLVDRIKDHCRKSMTEFDVNEQEVERTAQLFL
ncbi:MAG: hypothetical protein Q7S09_02255 [bacterium]|nr:hypothetical protein [bacterium]